MNFNKLYLMTLPRSGSTLIGQFLGKHSNIFHLGESMYWEIMDPKDSLCSCGDVGCSFLQKVGVEIKKAHLALPLLKVWQIVDKNYWPNKKTSEDSVIQVNDLVDSSKLNYWLRKCPNSLEKIISVYSKNTEKRIFLDNSKLFQIAEKLVNKKDSWGIIILLRDPRGIMSSYKNAGIRKGDFRGANSVLPFCNDFIIAASKLVENENVIICKYEDFCKNTKRVLVNLCNFIGVRFENSILNQSNFIKESKGHVLKGNRLLKLDKPIEVVEDVGWKNNLTQIELIDFYSNRKLIKKYSNFGYTFYNE